MRAHPQILQLGVMLERKLVDLKNMVEIFEVVLVKCDRRLRDENLLVALELGFLRQRPDESRLQNARRFWPPKIKKKIA